MTGKKRDLWGDVIGIIDITDRHVKWLFVPFLYSVGKSRKYRLRTKGTSKANTTGKYLSLKKP